MADHLPAAQPGDVVKLRSGGPSMTVLNVGLDAEGNVLVNCVWIDASGGDHTRTFTLPDLLLETPIGGAP